jgi:hypothetical protein
VRLIDVATQPKRRSLTVGGHLDLHHEREAYANAAPAPTA